MIITEELKATMVRPKISRTIESTPKISEFNPNGKGQRDEVVLTLEELEAVRLIDFEGLDQTQASVKMGISRQTFGRILKAARFIITKALVLGLQLKVTGGCYQVQKQGHRQRQRRGSSEQRRHGNKNSMEQQRESLGGTHMTENEKSSQSQDATINSDVKPRNTQGQGLGRGKGQGQGQGRGGGQGRGRGQGGGKGDGSCRRS